MTGRHPKNHTLGVGGPPWRGRQWPVFRGNAPVVRLGPKRYSPQCRGGRRPGAGAAAGEGDREGGGHHHQHGHRVARGPHPARPAARPRRFEVWMWDAGGARCVPSPICPSPPPRAAPSQWEGHHPPPPGRDDTVFFFFFERNSFYRKCQVLQHKKPFFSVDVFFCFLSENVGCPPKWFRGSFLVPALFGSGPTQRHHGFPGHPRVPQHGTLSRGPAPTIAGVVPRGGYAWVTKKLRGEVTVPLVAVNRINTPEVAEDILASGCSDMVCVPRVGSAASPSLPYFPVLFSFGICSHTGVILEP